MNEENKINRRKAIDGIRLGVADMAAAPAFSAVGSTAGGSAFKKLPLDNLNNLEVRRH